MRLYIETNFLLEIALLQREHVECEAILDHCGDGKNDTTIAIPASAVFEAQAALRNKRRHVTDFDRSYDVHISGQLSRVSGIAGVRSRYDDLFAQITASLNGAEARFEATTRRLVDVGAILPTDSQALEGAHGTSTGLAYEDALVYATIVRDPAYGCGPSYFVTTDGDFMAMKAEMAAAQCTLMPRFSVALAALRRHG